VCREGLPGRPHGRFKRLDIFCLHGVTPRSRWVDQSSAHTLEGGMRAGGSTSPRGQEPRPDKRGRAMAHRAKSTPAGTIAEDTTILPEDSTIRPFRIDVPHADLADLRRR